MDRRNFVIGAAASSGVLALPAHAAVSGSAIDAAFNYAYTLYEFARAMQRAGGAASVGLSPAERLNRLGSRRGLTDANSRGVTAPNNDTVYSSAFLELSGGPVDLVVPTVLDRYFSIAFMNAFTDNFFYIGTRATKGVGGKFRIVGPDWRGAAPANTTLIRSETNDVWMLGRILVTGPADVPAASLVQDQILLTLPPGRGPNRPILSPTDDGTNGEKVLAAANEMLGRQKRLVGQAARARQFRSLGIRPGVPNAFAGLSPQLQQAWRDAGPRGIARLRGNFARDAAKGNGWGSSSAITGNFGNNDLARATTALGGIAALGQAEAMYFSSITDGAGGALDASKSYRIRVPAAGVPVDGFWSVTMYAAEPDGRYFFVPNPISRYAVSDRSPGLVRNADGSIDIVLSVAQPDAATGGNWLPMPNGPFRVSFRAYVPRKEMLSGKWFPPPIQPLG